jgi:hypothetical protein
MLMVRCKIERRTGLAGTIAGIPALPAHITDRDEEQAGAVAGGRARSRSAAHRAARGCEGSDRDDRLRAACHESMAGRNAAATKGRPEHVRT